MRSYGTTPGRPEEYRRPGEKAVKPRDAATLIVVKQAKEPKILLGKRSMKHKFMPGKFVFPGGRLDYVDQRIKVPSELTITVLTRLRRETRSNVSDAKLRGLALAAIRETFEETGLVIGRPSTDVVRTTNNSWSQYFSHNVVPPLENMDFIARAITPPYRTRRFDTRFFMVHDSTIQSDPFEVSSASGELLDLHWLTINEARQTDLPAITRMVIDVVEERLKVPRLRQQAEPAPFVRSVQSKWLTSNL
ncbi:MAG: NUDIX hydrolase [Pseudomonadota bacterium]